MWNVTYFPCPLPPRMPQLLRGIYFVLKSVENTWQAVPDAGGPFYGDPGMPRQSSVANSAFIRLDTGTMWPLFFCLFSWDVVCFFVLCRGYLDITWLRYTRGAPLSPFTPKYMLPTRRPPPRYIMGTDSNGSASRYCVALLGLLTRVV